MFLARRRRPPRVFFFRLSTRTPSSVKHQNAREQTPAARSGESKISCFKSSRLEKGGKASDGGRGATGKRGRGALGNLALFFFFSERAGGTCRSALLEKEKKIPSHASGAARQGSGDVAPPPRRAASPPLKRDVDGETRLRPTLALENYRFDWSCLHMEFCLFPPTHTTSTHTHWEFPITENQPRCWAGGVIRNYPAWLRPNSDFAILGD